MPSSPGTRFSAGAAAGLAALLWATGCITQPHVGMETPGRPEVTWHHETNNLPAEPDVKTDPDTERQLLAELQAGERGGAQDLGFAVTLYNLAILRRRQGRVDEAAQLYHRALEIREREEGPNHPEVATTLNNLAGLEAARGNYDAAQPLLERALAIRETALGPEHPLTAQSLNNLALLYAARGNAAAAEPLYQRALAIFEKAGTPPRGELRRVLDNYAALLRDSGRDAEAEQLEARARMLRAATDQ